MSNRYWLHRISHEWSVSYALLNLGYLSIGWSKFTNSGILDIVREDGIKGFNLFMDKNQEASRSRWNLWHFAQYDVGDKIVVPLYDKEFTVVEVEERPKPISSLNGLTFSDTLKAHILVSDSGVYRVDKEEPCDLGFVVPIKSLTRIPRIFANADLVSRMKIRQTNADITDIKQSIEDAILAQAPVSIHDALIEATVANVQSVISRHITPDNLELIVKWYMKKMGADSVWIPAKNERNKENGADADVVAEFSDLRVIYYIQVKKHSGETSSWAIKQISEYKQQRQDDSNDYTYIPWVISTADFSNDAIEMAKANGVRLIGGTDLISMLLNCGINDIDSALE